MTCPNCGNNAADSMKFCPKCGTPMAVSPYVSPVSPPPPAWQSSVQPPIKRKSRVGKILLIVGIILVLLAGGIGVAIYFGVSSYLRSTRSSAAYALAESTLRSSQAVKDRLGELTKIGIPIGSFKEDADGSGFAFFFMSVDGEKASGQYVVGMERRRSVWRIQSAIVKLQSGEEIKVVETRYIPNEEPPDSGTDANENVNENDNANTSNSNNSNQKLRTVSGGVLNGKAISLPQPTYPPAARSARASGTVVVAVTLDENGNVMSASAVSGHPLLRASAIAAARQARFTPTRLGGERVKVSGTLTYNFVLEP